MRTIHMEGRNEIRALINRGPKLEIAVTTVIFETLQYLALSMLAPATTIGTVFELTGREEVTGSLSIYTDYTIIGFILHCLCNLGTCSGV